MSNALYGKGREGFLDGSIDWDTDDIRVILVDTGAYSVLIDTHDNLDDVAAGARIAVSTTLDGKTVTLGVADANDKTVSAVSGTTVEALIIYKHTGTESTSRLIAYIDDGTGLPVTPNGGDIILQWSSGADKIFKL